MAGERRLAIVTNRRREKMVLDVGPGDSRSRPDKSTGLEVIACTQATPVQDPLGADEKFRPPIELTIEGNRFLASVLEVHL